MARAKSIVPNVDPETAQKSFRCSDFRREAALSRLPEAAIVPDVRQAPANAKDANKDNYINSLIRREK